MWNMITDRTALAAVMIMSITIIMMRTAMMVMYTNMSIIMMRRGMKVTLTTMSIIITMRMAMTVIRMTTDIIITTQTKFSQAGAWRRLRHIRKRKSNIF